MRDFKQIGFSFVMWGFGLQKGNGMGVGGYVVEEDKAYLIHSRRDQFRVGPARHSSFLQNLNVLLEN